MYVCVLFFREFPNAIAAYVLELSSFGIYNDLISIVFLQLFFELYRRGIIFQ